MKLPGATSNFKYAICQKPSEKLHTTVQYFFVVEEVKQMIDLVGQLTMGNLAHDEGSLVTSPEGTSWVI